MLLQVNYFIIYILVIIGFCLSLLLIILNYIFGPQNKDFEKLSAYECGFIPFEDARVKFNVHFYLVGILFIIFDLEIAYLFPWAALLGCLSIAEFYVMVIFLIILTCGFIYEIIKGALDWSIISIA